MAPKDTCKVFTLDGNKFSDLPGFYRTFKNLMTVNGMGNKMEKSTFSFNAIEDMLRGGFGKFTENEEIVFIWKNSAKSKVDLAAYDGLRDHYEPLVRTLQSHSHIELRLM